MITSVSKNVIANVVGRVWGIISIYLFVPLYISLLGVESYGVISFYTILLTTLAFADAGLSATLNREFAKADIQNPSYKQNLLKTFEIVYLLIGLIIFSIIFFSADTIVSHFVKSEVISFDVLVRYVRMMGIIIVFYLLSSLYQGGMIGLQKQVLSNVYLIVYGIFRSGIILIPLIWFPYLDVYFGWQILIIIGYCLLLRSKLKSFIWNPQRAIFDFSYLQKLWRYAFGMMIIAIIYAANTQIDKLVISNMLSLKQLTYYTLATMVGQGIFVIATPIGLAFFPELTRLISLSEKEKYYVFFHKYSFIIATITSAITVVIFLYSYDYITIWTGKSDVASIIDKSAVVLTISSLFLSIQICPYYLALAHGHTKNNIMLGILSILILLPSLFFFITYLGLLGAALSSLIVNITITLILGYTLINKYMKGNFYKWLFFDSILPVGVSFIIGFFMCLLFEYFPKGWYTILYGGVIVLFSITINAIIFLKKYPEADMLFLSTKVGKCLPITIFRKKVDIKN